MIAQAQDADRLRQLVLISFGCAVLLLLPLCGSRARSQDYSQALDRASIFPAPVMKPGDFTAHTTPPSASNGKVTERLVLRGASVAEVKTIAQRAAMASLKYQRNKLSYGLRSIVDRQDRVLEQVRSMEIKITQLAKTRADDSVASPHVALISYDLTAVESEIVKLAASNFKVVCLLPEFSDGKPLSDRRIETAVSKGLFANRFTVYDWNFLSSEQPLINLADSTISGSLTGANKIGKWFLANWVIAGRIECDFSQDTAGILSYRAHCDVRAVNAATGITIPLDSYDAVGLSDTPAKARNGALLRLSEQMAADIPDKLLSAMPSKPIRLAVDRLSDNQRQQVLKTLSLHPGIADPKIDGIGNAAVIQAASRETASEVAAAITSELPELDFSLGSTPVPMERKQRDHRE